MKNRQPLGSEACGFTLLELLTVTGVVAILAALAIPAVQRVKASAHATACVANLRQIGAGLNAYLSENGMRMPELRAGRTSMEEDLPVIDNTLDRYIREPRIFACPADPKHAKLSGTSYYWNVALNNQMLADLNFLNLARDLSRIPILSDKEGFHPMLKDQVNILYADGHATKDLRFWSEEPKAAK